MRHHTKFSIVELGRSGHDRKRRNLLDQLGAIVVVLALVDLVVWTVCWTASGNKRVWEVFVDGEAPKAEREVLEELEFSDEDLETAVEGLALPRWSRGYTNCHSEESEVSCSQIVKAWRVLHAWEEEMHSKQFDQSKYYLMKHLYDGVGNRFSTDTATFLIALMENRSYIVSGNYPSGLKRNHTQAFDFHPAVHDFRNVKDTIEPFWNSSFYNVMAFDTWFYESFEQTPSYRLLYTDFLLYTTMPYTNHKLATFSRANFGQHMGYFVCNFLMRLPPETIANAKRLLQNVPNGTRVFGVHLRLQFPGQFYSYSVEQTMATVIPFLKTKLKEKPTVFAFASDSQQMVNAFKREFGNEVILTKALRKADADHDSALYDIALLEMCDECLLTYRSTFSYVVAMRMGKRAWFVEKESPGVFQASTSQATAISMLFHEWDVNDWQTNRRFHQTSKNEEDLRYYFRHFML